jgi:hypothetical protein
MSTLGEGLKAVGVAEGILRSLARTEEMTLPHPLNGPDGRVDYSRTGAETRVQEILR